MNRIYRTLWSIATQSWQAVPEIAKTAGKKSKSSAGGVVASVALGFTLHGVAHAQAPPAINQLPTGGTVVRGSATINQTVTAQAAAMTVNQSSQRAAINWNTFNLGSAASINFVQPNAQAVTLNRVNDSNPSLIFGRITSNGQVFLTNANGVYFSPTASVDVGAITATTHHISDDNFMSGKDVFERNGATGKVVNEGRISAALGGYVALLAPEVQNAGVVVARAGTVAMAAGDTITLNLDGAGSLAGITTTPSTIATLVENKQAVLAPDGQIILSAVALNKLQAGVIKNSGSLEANSLVNKGGKIVLEGDDITLDRNSKIEAKGPQGGGTVLVGGDWQGSSDLRKATQVTMEAGATIDASATEQGDGGKVVLWSDVHNANSVTKVEGRIEAKAAGTGQGGHIETSGHTLNVGNLVVNAQTTNGPDGVWLLDPYDITISSGTDATTSGTINTGTNTYTASASSSVVNVTTLQNALGSNNVVVSTTGGGADAGNITIANNLTWGGNGTTTKTLTLTASGGISGTGNIAMTGATGTGVIFSQAGDSTYSGAITGTYASLTKQGAGTLTLAGANSYKLTTVSAGTLKAGSATAFGNINTGTVIVAAGAAIDLNGNTMTGSIPGLTLNGTGVGGAGALINSSTTGATYVGSVVLGSDSSIVGDTGSIALSNAITGSGFGLTLGGTTGGSLSAAIGIGAGTLTKQGRGSWSLLGSSTYSGGTTINAGTIKVGSATALGTGAISVTSGAALDLYGRAMTSIGVLTLNGTGISGGGALMNSSVASAYAGAIVLGSDSTIVSGSGTNTITLSGNISGAYALTLDGAAGGSITGNLGTGAGTLTKLGSGTWSLTGANTYIGTTTISVGTLQIGNASTTTTLMGTGAVVNNGILAFRNATNQSFAPNTISGTGSVVVSGQTYGSGTLTLQSDNSFSGGMTVNSGPRVVAGGSSTSTAGAVTSGPFGTGTVTLTNGQIELAGYNIGNTLKSTTTVTGGTSPSVVYFNNGSGTAELSGQIDITSITTGTPPNTTTIATGLVLSPASGNTLRLTGALLSTAAYPATLKHIGAGDVFESFSSINAKYQIQLDATAGKWTLGNDLANTVGLGTKASLYQYGGTFDLAGNDLGAYLDGQSTYLSGGVLLNSASTTSKVWTQNTYLSGTSTTAPTISTPNVGGDIDLSKPSAIYGNTAVYTLTKTGAGDLHLRNSYIYSNVDFNINVLAGNLKYDVTSNSGGFSGIYSLAAGSTLYINSAPSAPFAGTITGDGAVVINATTTLSGANTYTGGTTVKNNATLTQGVATTRSGATILSSATGTGAITLGDATTSTLGNYNMVGYSTLTQNIYINGTAGITATGSLGVDQTISSLISDGSTPGTKSLSLYSGSRILEITGNNTYTGTTSITSGTGAFVLISNANALGTGAAGITIGAAGYIGSALKLAGNITFGKSITTANANISTNFGNLSGNNTFTGTYTQSLYPNTITSDAGTLTFAPASGNAINNGTANLTFSGAGNITVNGPLVGSGLVTKSGTGVLSLSGANTYTGGTNINAGILKVGSATALGTGATTVGTNLLTTVAALDLNGQTMTSTGDLTLYGTGINSSGALMNSSPTGATYAGLVKLGAASSIMGDTGTIALSNAGTHGGTTNYALTLGGAAGGSVAGILGISISALTKQNAGTWTLNGVNTFANTTPITISAGTLVIGGAGSLSSGNYSGGIANNGTFQYSSSAAQTMSGIISGTGVVTKDTSATSVLTLSGNNTYSGGTNFNSGTVSLGSANAIGITGTLSFGGGTLQFTTTNTTDYSARFSTAANQAYSLNTNGQSVTLASNLTSTGGSLTKLGTGTLTLTGVNTYSGGTNFNGGTLSLGSADAIGSAGTLSFGGGTLQFTASNTNDYSARFSTAVNQAYSLNTNGQSVTLASNLTSTGGSLTKLGTGNLTLTGVNTYSGGTNFNGGTLSLGSADAIGSAGTLSFGGGTLQFTVSNTNDYSARFSTAASQLYAFDTNGQSVALASNLTSAGASLTKLGAGDLTLSGANTYSGTTTLSTGTLKAGSATAFGTGVINVTSGAALDLNGQNMTSTGTLTLNGAGINSGGALMNSSATGATYAGLVALGSATSIVGGTGTVALSNSGTINSTYGLTLDGDAGGSIASIVGNMIALTKQGAGTWTLRGVNSYSGGTTISAGVLKAGSATSFGTGTLSVTSGAALDLNGQTMTSAGALTLRGTGISNGGALMNSSTTGATYYGSVVLGADSAIVGGAGSIALTWPSGITGSYGLTLGGATGGSVTGPIGTTTGSLTKEGAGTWTLNSANTFTGNTTISAGTLVIGSTGSLGSGSYAGAIANSGTFQYSSSTAQTLSGVISGSGGLTKNTSSTSVLTLSGTNTYTGNTVITLGTVAVGGAGSLGSGSYAGTIANSGTFKYSSSVDQTLSGVISGAGVLTKDTSAVSTLTLAGANTYSGANTLTTGTLKAGSVTAFGTGTISVASGAALDLNGQTMTSTGALTLSGTGVSSSGALMNSNATGATYAGLVTLGGASSIVGGSGTIALTNTGTISGSWGLTLGGAAGGSIASIIGTTTGTLTKNDAGTWTLSGVNTYSGTNSVIAGILKAGSNKAFGTGAISITSGAALDLNGQTMISTVALTLNGTGINSSGALMNSSATGATYAGLVALGSATSIVGGTGTVALSNSGTITGATFGLTLGGAAGGTIASIIGTTSGTVTKEGTGTWILSGANTFTGVVTINAGALRAANTLALGTTASGVTVASGATLELGGTTAPGSIAIGAEALTVADGGAVHNVAGYNTYAGAMTLSGNATITIDTGTTLNFNLTGGPAITVAAGKRLTLYTNGDLTFGKALAGGDANSSYLKVGSGTLTMGSGTTLTAAIGVYAGLYDPTGTDYSSQYGSTPDYTVAFYNAASGGAKLNLTAGTDFNGTALWTGTAPTASSNASTYSLTYASGVTLSSSRYVYIGSTSATNWTVMPKAVTVTLSAPSTYTYDASTTYATIASGLTTNATLVGADSISGLTSTKNATGVAQAGNFTVTPSAVTMSSGLASNYTFTYSPLTVAVAKAALSVTGTSVANKTYDRTTIATLSGGLLSGVLGSDTVVLTEAGTFASVNVGTGIAVTANYSIDNTSANNYTITQPTGLSANITAKALTVSGASAANKTYDGNNTATLSGSLVGVISGDTVTLSQAGTFASVNAGTGIAVIASDSLGGTSASNYTLTQPTGLSANISKANATVTASSGTGTYNGSLQSVSGFTVSGLVNNETAAVLTGVSASASGTNAGTYASTASGTDSNYALTFVNGALTINKANLTKVTASKVYDGLASVTASQVTALEGVNGETFTTTAGTATLSDKNVATANKTLTNLTGLTLQGGNSSTLSSNYNLSSNLPAAGVNNQVTISQAHLTVTANNATKTYGDTNPSLSTAVSGFVNSETLATSGVTGSGAASTTATALTGSGTATITAGVGTLAANNYDFTTFNNGTLTINKANATVAASSNTVTYNGLSQSVNGFTATGLVNGETASVLSGVTAGTTGINAGTYISVASGTAANYNLTFVNGALTINKANATVTANSGTTIYNGLSQSVSGFTTTGLVNNETASVLSGVTASGSGTNAGIYTSTASGTDSNYNLTFVNGALTINKANATVTANSGTTIYNGLSQSVSGFTATGLVNNETTSVLSGVTASGSGTNAGTYTSTASGTDSNYNLTFVNGALTINKANATVTANSSTTTYSGVAQSVSGFTATGLVNNETTSVLSGVTASGSGTNAGSYTSTASGTDTNYNLMFVNGALTINKAHLTVTANNATKTYGDTNPSLSTTVSGFVNGETLGTSGVNGAGAANTTATALTGAGTAPITAGVGTLAANNYDFTTFNNGTLTINKANATVTASSGTTTYSGVAQSVSGFTATGFVNGETASVLSGVTAGATGTNAGTYTSTASGTDSNYNLTFVNGAFTINKAPLSVVLSSQTKVYDGTSNATIANGSYTLTGFVSGEGGTVAQAQGSYNSANVVGASTVTASLTAGNYTANNGTLLSNYVLPTSATGTGSITPAQLSVTGAKTYDGLSSFDATALSVTGVNGETFSASGTGTMASKNVQSNLALASTSGISLSGNNGALTSNYTALTSNDTQVSVTPRAVNMSAPSANKTYDATTLYDATASDLTALSAQLVGSDRVSAAAVVFGNKDAGTGKRVTLNTVTISDDNGGNNYTVGKLDVLTGVINKAPLTVSVVNDARFIGQSDAANFAGVVYTGLVGGETAAVLSAGAITRSNASVVSAGQYNGVLQASGWQSNNYAISYNAGDYTIVGAHTLLVRVPTASTTYGTTASYAPTVQYLDVSNNTIMTLNPVMTGNALSVNDGVGGQASFTLTAANATLSSSGHVQAGGYNLEASSVTKTGSNFQNLLVTGGLTVTPKILNNNLGVQSITKVYDGSASISNFGLNFDQPLAGVTTGDTVSLVGSGSFDDRHVGTGKTVNLSLGLRGADATNYALTNANLSTNVGEITQLASVTYTGAANGVWSDASNWAGGALPDRNNVAQVIVPTGKTVVYNTDQVGVIGSTLSVDGAVRFASSNAFTLTNTVSGAGDLQQRGNGMLTVSGTNTNFSGNLDIGAYAAELGNAQALGTGHVVSNTGHLSVASGLTLPSLRIDGAVTLDTVVKTTGDQVYNGALTFLSSGTTQAPNFVSDAGDIDFMSTVSAGTGVMSAQRALVVSAPNGSVMMNDQVGRSVRGLDLQTYLASGLQDTSPYALSITAPTIKLNGDVTTFESQIYDGSVRVGNNGSNGHTRLLVSVDPSIIFKGTVDDADPTGKINSLDVRAISLAALVGNAPVPTVTFENNVGGVSPLASLRVAAGIQSTAASAVVTDIQTDDASRRDPHYKGDIVLKGNITLDNAPLLIAEQLVTDPNASPRIAWSTGQPDFKLRLPLLGSTSVLPSNLQLGAPSSNTGGGSNNQANNAGHSDDLSTEAAKQWLMAHHSRDHEDLKTPDEAVAKSMNPLLGQMVADVKVGNEANANAGAFTQVREFAPMVLRPMQPFIYKLPEDTFVHSDGKAQIMLSAKLSDGTALPRWLKFSAKDSRFSGTPPKGVKSIEIVVTATDSQGRRASTRVRLVFGNDANV